MRKRHALGISILAGLAVVAGAFAVVKSVQAGDSQSSSAPQAAISEPLTALDRYEAQLDAALAEARAQAGEASPSASLPAAVASVRQDVRTESGDAYEHETDDHDSEGYFEGEAEDD